MSETEESTLIHPVEKEEGSVLQTVKIKLKKKSAEPDLDIDALCSDFTSKTNIVVKEDEVVKETKAANTKIEGLEYLKEVYQNKDAQRGLIMLYCQSQAECMRNGSCGMEIGMAREKDQGSVLKLFLGDKINLDIDNSLTEDFVIGKEKISSKHTTGKLGTSIKAKWTSADISVKEAIQDMIDADDSYYPHLLLTYFDTKAKNVTVVCITSEHNKHVIKTLQKDAFTVPKGNSRGIEYSRKAMTQLLEKRYFTIEIPNVELKGGLNPIERRMQQLKSAGICP